jgi:hypothetical protein
MRQGKVLTFFGGILIVRDLDLQEQSPDEHDFPSAELFEESGDDGPGYDSTCTNDSGEDALSGADLASDNMEMNSDSGSHSQDNDDIDLSEGDESLLSLLKDLGGMTLRMRWLKPNRIPCPR